MNTKFSVSPKFMTCVGFRFELRPRQSHHMYITQKNSKGHAELLFIQVVDSPIILVGRLLSFGSGSWKLYIVWDIQFPIGGNMQSFCTLIFIGDIQAEQSGCRIDASHTEWSDGGSSYLIWFQTEYSHLVDLIDSNTLRINLRSLIKKMTEIDCFF